MLARDVNRCSPSRLQTITHVALRYDKERAHLSSALEGLEVFSCQLQSESSTALSIVDPCNAQIEMNTVFEADGSELTDVEIDFVSPSAAIAPERYEEGSLEMRFS
jgi:hypothetical protein